MGDNLSLTLAVAGLLVYLVGLALTLNGNLLVVPLVVLAIVLAIILIRYGE